MKLNKIMSIRRIFNEHLNEKLSVNLSYKIMKFMKASDNEDAFYSAEMQKLIEEFAEKDKDGKLIRQGNGVKIMPEKIKECQQTAEKLNETEIEKPNINFTIEELGELKLSVSEMYVLDEIIKGE